MSKITDIVRALAEPVAERNGCELWDVEYVREAGTNFLRVYIDREGGVDIALCEAVSRELDPILDERDPIPDSYTFEVSSAGAERALKRDSDFERFMGSFVEVRTYKAVGGRKEHLGTLSGYNEGEITITAPSGETVTFKKGEAANVRLRIK